MPAAPRRDLSSVLALRSVPRRTTMAPASGTHPTTVDNEIGVPVRRRRRADQKFVRQIFRRNGVAASMVGCRTMASGA
jgi:hypothetical protein